MTAVKSSRRVNQRYIQFLYSYFAYFLGLFRIMRCNQREYILDFVDVVGRCILTPRFALLFVSLYPENSESRHSFFANDWLWVRSLLEEIYLNLYFYFPGIEAKSGVKFHYSTRNASNLWRKVGSGVSSHQVPSAYPAVCGIQREKIKKKYNKL